MKVFKFGGASVKDASAVKNVAAIFKLFPGDDLAIVISAMGKTTNALERLTHAWFYKSEDPFVILDEIKKYHYDIMAQLFPDNSHAIYIDINNNFVEIEWAIEEEAQRSYDFEYDQIVSIGEILSSKIVSAYLNEVGIKNKWQDVRDFIQTDNTYREGKVNWELTQEMADKTFMKYFSDGLPEQKVIITQGFIGGTSENYTTTLGREGSDFTAAIIAYVTNSESVTIWKDVPGVLNADPKWFDETEILEQLSYHDAIELAYYGASVIHPKTIKPLQNKNISLYVKSFLHPENSGTLINGVNNELPVPSFIFKVNQVLISIMPKDFSFIIEENLSDIFKFFAEHRIKINVMQNTAVSFSVSIDNDEEKIPLLVKTLQADYKVLYNENLELITIRHYDQQTINRVSVDKEVILELKSRNTVQLVVKPMGMKSTKH